MLGIFSPVTCDNVTGYGSLMPYVRSTSAVSSAAMTVKRTAIQIIQLSEWSQVLFGGKSDALSQLLELAMECNEPNWDGADAAPIDAAALMNAQNMICALPENIPMPEFAIDPDGSIALDWIRSRHRIFSVSISASSRLAYAWLDGSDKGHGVASFDGDIVPARIIEGICEIMNHG